MIILRTVEDACPYKGKFNIRRVRVSCGHRCKATAPTEAGAEKGHPDRPQCNL